MIMVRLERRMGAGIDVSEHWKQERMKVVCRLVVAWIVPLDTYIYIYI